MPDSTHPDSVLRPLFEARIRHPGGRYSIGLDDDAALDALLEWQQQSGGLDA